MGIIMRGEFGADFKALERALFALDIGEIAGPVETPLGFHVIKRVPIREWAASHILVRHEASADPPGRPPLPNANRTREEARKLAESLRAKLPSPATAEAFAALARAASEAIDRHSGGELGVVTTGVLPPALERAVRSIETGEVAGPIETAFGFHLVRREFIRRALVRGVSLPITSPAERETVRARLADLAKDIATERVFDSATVAWPREVRERVERLDIGETSEPMEIGGAVWVFERVE